MVKKIKKPWGSETIWAKSKRIVGKTIKINKGHRLSLQYHEKKEEAIYVVNGKLTLVLKQSADGDGEEITMSPGDSYYIKAGEIHRFEARNSDVMLVEVSTPEINDVVRLEDDYKRK